MSATPLGLLLSDDLMFSSRITATARAAGLAMKTALNVVRLEDHVKQQTPSLLILDLANPSLRVEEFLPRLRETCSPVPHIVAYGSHVDAATLQGAREAGCDLVLPRSKFVEALEGELPKWMEGKNS